MESYLNIDLSEHRKTSPLLLLTGAGLLGFLIFILVWRQAVPSWHKVPVLDGTAYLLLFLAGAGLIIAGTGLSFRKSSGKAFAAIDNEKISVKTSRFEDVQLVYWDNIESISCSSCKLHIHTCNKTILVIDLSELDSSLENSIRTTVRKIAGDKGLIMT
jgi:hypothetical protein